MKKLLALVLAAALLTACTPDPTTPTDTASTEPTSNPEISQPLVTGSLFSNRDLDPGYQADYVITFSGTAIQAEGAAVEGTTVTLSKEGVYLLEGQLTDGMVIVDAPKDAKLQLVLGGVQLHSETSAPIYVRQADKVFVTLAAGTPNTLSNGGSFTAIDENNIDAALFSREDLTLNGTGSLEIISPAGHGVVSKDSLKITGGSYTLTTASHGFTGKDDVCITGAACTVTSGKDAIHAENNDDASLGFVYIRDGSFTLDAQGDGISAAAQMQIDGGTFQITTGGGSENASQKTSENWGGFGGMGGGRPGGMGGFGGTGQTDSTEDSTSIKALKAGTQLVVNGGSFTVDAADDAVHSNGDLTLAGGTFTIATGDDGFHADETLTVAAGAVTITESYEGLEGLHIRVTGGTVTLSASDDGLNAAGGTDQSGFGGHRGGDMFGGPGGKGGMGGAGNGSIVIAGGTLNITASGDGIDANGTLEITGGHTTVCGPTRGDTATLDYDISAVIRGGVFLGTGASGMAQTFSGSEQGVIAVQGGSCGAGTQITLTDSSGNILLSHTPALDFAVVILSSPDLVKGETYTLTIGTASKTLTAQ